MNLFINLIIFFWFAVVFKYSLFWIYLWQLKEYHVGRFVDHFRTHKGKKLLLGPLFLAKLFLLGLLLVSSNNLYLVFYLLFLVYTAEFLIFVIHIVKRNVKKPVATLKSIFLTAASLIVVTLYFFTAYRYVDAISGFIFVILIFDILTPLVVTFVVLLFQPFFVLARNTILKKAKEKIATFKNLTVIGITGSYGKTSTKEFLTTILSQKFNVVSTPEHKNSEIGIAQTILSSDFDKFVNQTRALDVSSARPNTQKDLSASVFIVEMGSYNKGGISLLCDMVKPKIGVVTGVNEQHLATFGSLSNLLSAEGGEELVDSLPQDGVIILNGDNKYCLDLYKKTERVHKKIYTLKRDKIHSDIWTEDITVNKDNIAFIARDEDKHMAHFTVNVLGKQNIQNMLGAMLVAKQLGMSMEEISSACKNIQQEQAGITLTTGIHGIIMIDSSYSSNSDGVMADLDYLNVFDGKKIIVMPCLIELGKKSKVIHYQIGKKIAEVCDMVIITTKDQFENIKRGAVEQGMFSERIILCDKPNEILAHITTFCKHNDAVLLEGRVPNEIIKLLVKN